MFYAHVLCSQPYSSIFYIYASLRWDVFELDPEQDPYTKMMSFHTLLRQQLDATREGDGAQFIAYCQSELTGACSQRSPLDWAVNHYPERASWLYDHGARYNESDYALMVTDFRVRGAIHLEHWLQYAEPHPKLEAFARELAMEISPRIIDRLLRLAVPAAVFSSDVMAYFLLTALGQWWRLRTGSSACLRPVLPADLVRYVWQAL